MSEVVLLPWSESWTRIFADTREQLLAACAPAAVAIEHVGSTAVPGLCAKPVIDVLLGANSLSAIEARIGALGAAGFIYVSKHERELPERRYFVKQPANSLRVHVHGVVQGALLWRQHLAFRDALREDAALRGRYQSLKRDLAAQFAKDKAAYTEAKAPFIRAALAAGLAVDGGTCR